MYLRLFEYDIDARVGAHCGLQKGQRLRCLFWNGKTNLVSSTELMDRVDDMQLAVCGELCSSGWSEAKVALDIVSCVNARESTKRPFHLPPSGLLHWPQQVIYRTSLLRAVFQSLLDRRHLWAVFPLFFVDLSPFFHLKVGPVEDQDVFHCDVAVDDIVLVEGSETQTNLLESLLSGRPRDVPSLQSLP